MTRDETPRDPLLSEYQRGYVDGFDAPANIEVRAALASSTQDALDVEALALAKFYDDNPNDHDLWDIFGEASREAVRKWARRIATEYAGNTGGAGHVRGGGIDGHRP